MRNLNVELYAALSVYSSLIVTFGRSSSSAIRL